MARYIMLMTRDPEGQNPYKCISMWLLPTDTPGVRFSQMSKVGWWTRPQLRGVYRERLRAEDQPDRRDEPGLAAADGQLRDRAPGAVRCLAGRGRRRLRDAAAYANQREQFGKPIGSYQAVQHMITDMAIKIENMRNYIYKIAWMMDNDHARAHEHAMCKLYVARPHSR